MEATLQQSGATHSGAQPVSLGSLSFEFWAPDFGSPNFTAFFVHLDLMLYQRCVDL